MRANSSFSKKIEFAIAKPLLNELHGFAGMAACAGIKGKWKQARKARGNHYGEFIIDSEGNNRQIPVRRFVWAATRDSKVTPYSNEIAAIIARGIHDNPAPHTQEWEYKRNGQVWDVGYKEKSGRHGTPVFAGKKGARGLMEKIAKQMEINQFNAIETRNITVQSAKALSNAESTIRQKGFDHPLVWKGDMQMAIEGWVEEV